MLGGLDSHASECGRVMGRQVMFWVMVWIEESKLEQGELEQKVGGHNGVIGGNSSKEAWSHG